MKILPIFLLIIGTSLSAWSQGTIWFANRVPPYVAPVFDVDGVTPLSGSGFYAQLFAGPFGTGEGALTPVGTPVTFRTGALAGTWAGVEYVIPGVPGGAIATLQVRAWVNEGGLHTMYFEAILAGAPAGKSSLFDSLPLGDNIVGILPPNIVGNPDPRNNLSSFSLVSEPSVVLLGALGAAALLLRRRNTEEIVSADQRLS